MDTGIGYVKVPEKHVEIYEEIVTIEELSFKKYQSNSFDTRVAGFVEESGEALQCVGKLMKDRYDAKTRDYARLELLQCAGQIIRLLAIL